MAGRTQSESSAHAVAAGQKLCRVGIVDDDDGVRLLLRTLIELEPDLVVAGEAADGGAAIDLVLHESPDLLILDLAMPGMDGLEVLEELGRRDCRTRVIVYSGFGSPDVERAARDLGAVDFLVKGFDPPFVIQRLRSACG